jgi:hypothetical protein
VASGADWLAVGSSTAAREEKGAEKWSVPVPVCSSTWNWARSGAPRGETEASQGYSVREGLPAQCASLAVPGARGLYLHWHCTTIHSLIHSTHPTPVPNPPSCASADNLALCPVLTNQKPLSTRSRCEITCGASRMQWPRGL